MDDSLITTPQELGTRIRQRRKALGLTQSEVAATARTTLRFISELERGKRTAQLEGVLRVLQTLGLDLSLQSR
jgi:HTH-type transcriptional regulator / antitoxin HipB